jgi:diaminopimelate decarboxylase
MSLSPRLYHALELLKKDRADKGTALEATIKLFPETAQIDREGHICVGGVDLVDLAHKWGTPLYLYDETTIRARCRAYCDALAASYPGPAQVAYACKSFLCMAIAQLIGEEGLGLDVVSGGELHIALKAGFPSDRIHFHGNNKTPDEIACALDAGVGRFVADNLHELKVLGDLASRRDRSAQIWLRLSPGIDVHTHDYRKTGLADSKFGLSLQTSDVDRAIEYVLDNSYLRLVGLHAHIGSQVFDTEPFVEAVEVLLDVLVQIRDRGLHLSELSPGGGLGVPYVDPDPTLTIDSYVHRLCAAVIQGCRSRGLPLPRLVLEPGRSITGPAGVALYTVGARKEIPGGRTYVSVDGGLADNPRPALYQADYTALLASKADEPLAERVSVVGKFCESGDVLIQSVQLPRTQPGDLLAVPVSGAYQLSMSSNYNQALRPAVFLVGNGQARLIVRRETYEDLMRRDLPLDNCHIRRL